MLLAWGFTDLIVIRKINDFRFALLPDGGTVKVWGYASRESVDSDGETVTAEAMIAAIHDCMKFEGGAQDACCHDCVDANLEISGMRTPSLCWIFQTGRL